MWTCKMCGAENADGAIFCKDCGDRYEPTAADQLMDVQPLGPDGTPIAPAAPVVPLGGPAGPPPAGPPLLAAVTPPPAPAAPPASAPGPLTPPPPPSQGGAAPPGRAVFLLAFDRDGNVAAEFQLKEGINLIGITSVPDNIFPDVDLDAHDPDQIVSRRHAVITVSGDQFLIEDQRSTNGTWVNGQRLRPHTPQQLLHGDDIVFSQRVRSRFAVR